MYKELVTISVLSLVLVGCSEEEGNGGKLLEITNDNAASIVAAPLAYGSIIPDTETVQRILTRDITITEDILCESGNGSAKVTKGDNFNQGGGLFNGSITSAVTYNSCVIKGVTYEGKVTNDIEFNDMDLFGSSGSLKTASKLDNFKAKTGSEYEYIDGSISITSNFDTSSIILNWDIVTANSELEGLNLKSQSTTNIEMGIFDGLVVTGGWKIEGSNNSSIVATTVPNGVEYSVNNDQNKLLSWNEIPD